MRFIAETKAAFNKDDAGPKQNTVRAVRAAPRIGRRLLDLAAVARTPLHELNKVHGLDMVVMEGFMRPPQFEWFRKLFAANDVRRVAETGFNGGHSAFAFSYFGAEQVTSFDIGEHGYVHAAQTYLKQRFPDTNFELVLGDSTETVPKYDPQERFDLAFVDGGHSEAVAASDLATMKSIVVPNGYVVVDDYGGSHHYEKGPQVAYDRAVNEGLIEHIENQTVNGHSWTFGQYKD